VLPSFTSLFLCVNPFPFSVPIPPNHSLRPLFPFFLGFDFSCLPERSAFSGPLRALFSTPLLCAPSLLGPFSLAPSQPRSPLYTPTTPTFRGIKQKPIAVLRRSLTPSCVRASVLSPSRTPFPSFPSPFNPPGGLGLPSPGRFIPFVSTHRSPLLPPRAGPPLLVLRPPHQEQIFCCAAGASTPPSALFLFFYL